MERHELINKYEKRLQEYNSVEIYQIYSEIIRDLFDLEQPKVEVPEFVAAWIEKSKAKGKGLLTALSNTPEKVNSWVDNSENQELFANAWISGYTIEEKRYRVKMKAIKNNSQYLVFGQLSETWWFGSAEQIGNIKSEHTRKEIEDAGFGEVFNSPLFEVEEVE